jgi:hypothetical protein
MHISYTALEVLLPLLRMAKVEHPKETICGMGTRRDFEIPRLQVFTLPITVTPSNPSSLTHANGIESAMDRPEPVPLRPGRRRLGSKWPRT